MSDTRREDAAREIAKTHWTTTHEGFHCVGCGWRDVGTHEDYGQAARRHVAEVALAVLPAPPVVNETALRIEADAAAEQALPFTGREEIALLSIKERERRYYARGYVAARLRGATR